MRRLDIDWSDLELAFRDATGTENHLDTESGEIVAVIPGFTDEESLRTRVKAEPRRYVLVPPIDAKHAREVMSAFVDTVDDPGLKVRMQKARHGAGSLTRCLALLREDQRQLQAYYRFEQASFWRHVEAFLSERGVEPASPPPAPELFEDAATG